MCNVIEAAWKAEFTDGELSAVHVYCENCMELIGNIDTNDYVVDVELEFEEIDGKNYCNVCAESKTRTNWYDETEEACRKLAEEFSFSFKQTGGWGKSSWYFELGFVGEDDEYREINLRISNHGVLYCKGNDISISMNPTPDDHTIDDLRKMMKELTKLS